MTPEGYRRGSLGRTTAVATSRVVTRGRGEPWVR
jgi:hypothetical protein